MVTEKDLYVGMKFEASAKNYYTIYSLDVNNSTIKHESGETYLGYEISEIIYFLNNRCWRLVSPINRCIEIW